MFHSQIIKYHFYKFIFYFCFCFWRFVTGDYDVHTFWSWYRKMITVLGFVLVLNSSLLFFSLFLIKIWWCWIFGFSQKQINVDNFDLSIWMWQSWHLIDLWIWFLNPYCRTLFFFSLVFIFINLHLVLVIHLDFVKCWEPRVSIFIFIFIFLGCIYIIILLGYIFILRLLFPGESSCSCIIIAWKNRETFILERWW